ncbi:MAG: hypothetical protein WC445_01555 [Patescibacteria group bacterium]
MGKVKFLVKGGGSHEFSCGRLERMLREACRRFNFGLKLKPEDITVMPDSSIPASQEHGIKDPLQITIGFSPDLLEHLAPPFETREGRSDSALRRFVQTMGETARRIGPENGWPQRQVEVSVPLTDVSWRG